MPTLTIYAATATAITGSWTNVNNAVGGGSAGSYAQWTSSTANATAILEFTFDVASQLPAHATIDSLSYTWKHNVGSTTDMIASQTQRVEGNNVLATNTGTLGTSTGTSNTNTFSITLPQLRSPSYRIRFVGRKANTTVSSYARIDWCYLTINYTDGVPQTVSATLYQPVTLTGPGEGQWVLRDSSSNHPATTDGPNLTVYPTPHADPEIIRYDYPGIQAAIESPGTPYQIALGYAALGDLARASVVPYAEDPVYLLAFDDFRTTRQSFLGATPVIGPTWKTLRHSGATNIYSSGGHIRCDLNGGSYADAHLDLGSTDGKWSFQVGEYGEGGLHICCYRVAEGNEILIGEFNGNYTVRDWGPGGSSYVYMNGTPKIKSGDVVYVHIEAGWLKIWVNGVIRRDVAIQYATGGTEYGFRWDTGAWGSSFEGISAEPLNVTIPEAPAPQNPDPYVADHTTSAVPSSVGDKSIATPSVQAGEMLLMILTTSSGSLPSLPSGFTQVASHTVDTSNPTTLVGYRIATSSEPASYTPTIPSGISYRGDLLAIAYPGNSVPTVVQQTTPGSDTSHAIPAVPEGTDKGLVILSAAVRATTGVPTTFSWQDTLDGGINTLTDLTANSLISVATWRKSSWSRATTTAGPWTAGLTRSTSEGRPGLTTTIVIPHA